MATDEQIERVRQLTYTVTFPSDSTALAAVLEELATLRANMSSLVDSGIEPPRQVREERDRLRKLAPILQRAVDDQRPMDVFNGVVEWYDDAKEALAKCEK